MKSGLASNARSYAAMAAQNALELGCAFGGGGGGCGLLVHSFATFTHVEGLNEDLKELMGWLAPKAPRRCAAQRSIFVE